MAGLTLPDTVQTAYAAALQQVLGRVPSAQRDVRTASLEAFLLSGFPAKRLEDWRYTDLAPLSAQAFALAEEPSLPDLSQHYMPGTHRMVFINGRFSEAASSPLPAGLSRCQAGPAQPDSDPASGIAQLNASLATDGILLKLERGQSLDLPVHVLSVSVPGDVARMSHVSHRIELLPGSSATVIFEDRSLGSGSHFLTQSCQLQINDNARLDLVRMQEHGRDVQALTRWHAEIGRDASLDWLNLDLGGALVRNDICADLAHPNASLDLSGVFITGNDAHIDNYTRIEHRSTHGRSRQAYRGIAADRSRGIFRGRVAVHRNAIRTDSDMQVANLLLSPLAEINAKPELQIDNDDVKCAHGASCGQLDADSLYYLQSRGLPLAAAREVLLFGFANEILQKARFTPARQMLLRALLTRFPSGAEAGITA